MTMCNVQSHAYASGPKSFTTSWMALIQMWIVSHMKITRYSVQNLFKSVVEFIAICQTERYILGIIVYQ